MSVNVNNDGSIYQDVTVFSRVASLKDKLAVDPKISFVSEQDEKETVSGKPFVVLMHHNDVLSWLGSVPAIADNGIQLQEKHGRKIYPFALYHRALEKVPLFGAISRRFTGNVVTDYDHLMNILNTVEGACIGTSPEGINCNYDFGTPAAKFSQYGILRAALSTDCNVLILTLKQDRPMSWRVEVPHLEKIVDGARAVKVPYFRRVGIRGTYELYNKPYTPSEFCAIGRDEQRNILQSIGDDVRARMNARYEIM